jgi:hypothetical protein
MPTGTRNCQGDVKTSSSFEAWGEAGDDISLCFIAVAGG